MQPQTQWTYAKSMKFWRDKLSVGDAVQVNWPAPAFPHDLFWRDASVHVNDHGQLWLEVGSGVIEITDPNSIRAVVKVAEK